MAPDDGHDLVLSGQSTTSNRLAVTVAGEGADQSPYRKGFKAYSQPLDGQHDSSSEPQYVLVDDVTPMQFESFVKEGKQFVGAENLFVNLTGQIEPDGHSDYLSLPHFEDVFKVDEAERFMASGHIQPGSVEQVASVVKLANKCKQPLHAISMGQKSRLRWHCCASTRNRHPRSQRRNKVLQIDEESAFYLLEPGVSYFNLYEELQRRNSQVWIDFPDI